MIPRISVAEYRWLDHVLQLQLTDDPDASVPTSAIEPAINTNPSTSVVETSSPPNAQPRSTATAGFTYVCVDTSVAE